MARNVFADPATGEDVLGGAFGLVFFSRGTVGMVCWKNQAVRLPHVSGGRFDVPGVKGEQVWMPSVANAQVEDCCP